MKRKHIDSSITDKAAPLQVKSLKFKCATRIQGNRFPALAVV